MKTLRLFFFFLLVLFTSVATAQLNKTTLKVAGECGMCKKTIETAARDAGALFAEWNAADKLLTVQLSSSTTKEKIEKRIAGAGYDTESIKASDEAYNKLHACCKYERTSGAKIEANCCKDNRCNKAANFQNETCSVDKMCCKEAGCDTKDCCKKA